MTMVGLLKRTRSRDDRPTNPCPMSRKRIHTHIRTHAPLVDLQVGPSKSVRSCGVHSREPGPKLCV